MERYFTQEAAVKDWGKAQFREGSAEKSRKTAIRLRSIGWDATAIANLLEEDEATIEQWIKNV